MKALLLAAGQGTRLRPLTDHVPKCLAPIRGRPLLEYWLSLLVSSGAQEIVLNTHHHSDLVVSYVKSSPWANMVRLSHETELLGTGGTVLKHSRFFDGNPVLVAHADNLTSFDPLYFLRAHRGRPHTAVMTMMTFRTQQPQNCGIVELDEQNLVVGFHEKVANPPGNLANAAVFCLEQPVIELMQGLGRTHLDLSIDVIPRLTGKIFTYLNTTYHRDIGTMESLSRAQTDFPSAAVHQTPKPDPWESILSADRGRLERVLCEILGSHNFS